MTAIAVGSPQHTVRGLLNVPKWIIISQVLEPIAVSDRAGYNLLSVPEIAYYLTNPRALSAEAIQERSRAIQPAAQ